MELNPVGNYQLLLPDGTHVRISTHKRPDSKQREEIWKEVLDIREKAKKVVESTKEEDLDNGS